MFVHAVVKESLRLYPPVWVLARLAKVDTELAGVAVPKGSQVLGSQWVIQRDERWFSEAEHFRPERWLDGSCEKIPRFAYYPFGGGAHMCLGMHFAHLQVKAFVHQFLLRYRFGLSPGQRVEMTPIPIPKPKDGLPLRLERVA